MSNQFPYLSLLMFLPVLGIGIIAPLRREWARTIRYVALGIALVQLGLTIALFFNYDSALSLSSTAQNFQYIEQASWIKITGLGVFGNMVIDYHVGVDGLSVVMILLAVLSSLVATIASFSIDRDVKAYFILFQLLVTGLVGVFSSLDLFLFYMFWVLTILSLYFLIGMWGGERREYASIKFIIYTLFGSVILLLVIIGLYFSTTATPAASAHAGTQLSYHTFSIVDLLDPAKQDANGIFAGTATDWRYAGYIALLIAFAITIPAVPLHSWFTDATVNAPAPISALLAGVLTKMGAYGILRICYGAFPEIAISTSWYLAMFGFINVVYGALCAISQNDLKRLISYAAISQMGYVLLGIASINTQGIIGGAFQMFNHGIIIVMLYISVGYLLERTSARGVAEFGGLANQMPRYFGFSIIAFFAVLGLPLLSSFVSQALVFLGAFQKWQLWTTLATLGIILTAAYMLWTLQKMFFGSLPERIHTITDLSYREMIALVPLVIVIIVLGIYPSLVIELLTGTANQIVSIIGNAGITMGQASLTR